MLTCRFCEREVMRSISCPLADFFFSFQFSETKFINPFKNVKHKMTLQNSATKMHRKTESKVIGFLLKVLYLCRVSGHASSHSKMYKWMWMMQQKWWIIQQAICHSRLLLGFVCPARTCQNKDSPPGDGKLLWASAVPFWWLLTIAGWVIADHSGWLSWDHKST